MKRTIGSILAILVLGLAAQARAQIATGNIYGTITDESGGALRGVTVTLSGATGARSTNSSETGQFRFLNLDPGAYKVSATLTGFVSVARDVVVDSGVSLTLPLGLKVGGTAEVITVTAESPVIDTRKTGTSTTLTREELEKIPNSRDPWAILRTVPGVQMDRVNIAGSESGQQATFFGKGSLQADVVWNLDGIVISDPAAAGSSPAYYDFDAFDQITYETGGNDIKMSTGGIGINFVTKRGTNAFHGNAHGFFTNHQLQSSNLPASLVSDPRLKNPDGTSRDQADHIEQLADYGADFGGPLMKDKLWFWGSYGKQDIRLQRLSGTRDKTLLKTFNAKVNWQASPADMVSFTYFNNFKDKFGRSVGPGQDDGSYTRDQANDFASRLHGLWKGEWNRVFSPSFTGDLKYAWYDQGFSLTPEGGLDQSSTVDFASGVQHGSSPQYQSVRPTHTASVDFNYSRGRHEFKFGFGFRQGHVDTTNAPPGNQLVGQLQTTNDLTASEAVLERTSSDSFGGKYINGYLQDTVTSGRLTANLGLRFDHQAVANRPSTGPANASFPEILPALTYDGSGQSISFNDLSPRASMTYALDESRKSVLHASLARYAGQLSWGDVTSVNPIGGIGKLFYHWNDLDGDGFVQPGEVDFASGQIAPPINGGLSTANRIDPNYHATHDLEAIVGFDREVMPNLAMGVSYTWRRQTGAPWAPYLGLSGSEFSPLPSVSANGYTVTGYTPGDTPGPDFTGGLLLQNRPDYHRTYNGVEFTANKRLKDRWMARVAVSYNDWKEYFNGSAGLQNPSPTIYDTYGYQAWSATVTAEPLRNGGQVVVYGAGSGRALYFSSKWTANASALYELGWGVDVAANLYARQGNPRLIRLTVAEGFLGPQPVLVTPVDTARLPDLYNLDLRLSKTLKLGGNANLVASVDAFNIFNSNATLNQNNSADGSHFDRIDTILNPRTIRFGLRFNF
jgi:hypothetical protein